MLFLYINFFLLVLLINFSLVYNRTITNLLFLVFTIFCSGFFFCKTIGVEFLMFAYFIVYVGAIMVMFLFVVMVVDVSNENSKSILYDDFFVGLSFNTLLTSILYLMFQPGFNLNKNINKINLELSLVDKYNKYDFLYAGNYIELSPSCIKSYLFLENISIFGEYLFFNCYVILLAAGLILLIAMIISILICQSFSNINVE